MAIVEWEICRLTRIAGSKVPLVFLSGRYYSSANQPRGYAREQQADTCKSFFLVI